VRNWSYDTLEREVRANPVYRAFTRIGDEKVPDAKTLARLGQVIGPEVIGELHERLMELARERGVVQGRKMRVDTTVVETNVHYPTDSALLGDGARVLTRTMKKVEKAAGGLKKRWLEDGDLIEFEGAEEIRAKRNCISLHRETRRICCS
jgi:IS5 family transposase